MKTNLLKELVNKHQIVKTETGTDYDSIEAFIAPRYEAYSKAISKPNDWPTSRLLGISDDIYGKYFSLAFEDDYYLYIRIELLQDDWQEFIAEKEEETKRNQKIYEVAREAMEMLLMELLLADIHELDGILSLLLLTSLKRYKIT